MSHTVRFDQHLTTSLSASRVWHLLDDAFRDSESSPLWPGELERIISEGLKEGGRVRVIYRLLGAREYQYVLSEVVQGERFTYRPVAGHPMEGEVQVSLVEEESGTIIRWQGVYRTDSLLAKLYTRYFIYRFFRALKENLDRLAAVTVRA